jgi:hypothetical protein
VRRTAAGEADEIDEERIVVAAVVVALGEVDVHGANRGIPQQVVGQQARVDADGLDAAAGPLEIVDWHGGSFGTRLSRPRRRDRVNREAATGPGGGSAPREGATT